MKAGVSQVIVDTFVVACLGLAGAIIGLEYALDGDEAACSELTNGKDEVADDAVRAHVSATWRSAALSRGSASAWRDLKLFLDEHVAPELPKMFRLIGQHWLTPKTAWLWSVVSSWRAIA
ncbi:hypothetical protein CYME_CMS380C [Cyanidioschyzon merolae strain 10D]|uniref:Uncharacterized protein n=1 Tax=Cyanidioschyzon merolae (strain NIES-3377 / 10D) TaxID=280699 RepID=M1UX44_CYAM1|nr:hypothetical protein CYME_CMS380C [Cyanidioschyzon merolae strain 10D]BAM82951.1 hypothetical protein CYME_CMS380C [Cyanidioschyzon merolae strain 10D]|eukprot:XP_005538987.1 hypothetical protein CYME_CMS380C [Cyanidioschyzon merolae strain 10D]